MSYLELAKQRMQNREQDALITEPVVPAGMLPRLPVPLEQLVHAAVTRGLPQEATLPDGRASDFSRYVMACASAYLLDDGSTALAHLWAAHRAWKGKPS